MESAMPKRIGDLAKAAGVGVETVRFYEREGLVDKPLKPERGWR
ncbi:MAG TPA: MerR family DNA-binding transcriptional regulator, partial [Rhizomicrobium sp.]|nr:MerR family DNA-binding transcriptional regulator [Rhizomicrobium sp.]